MKNVKRGGPLDYFLMQILFSHWSKSESHDRILCSDWITGAELRPNIAKEPGIGDSDKD